MLNNVPVGFCAVIHFPHPQNPNIKKVHRIVVLPDYQGIGVAKFMLTEIPKLYKDYDFYLTSSSLAMFKALQKHPDYYLIRKGYSKKQTGNIVKLNKSSSSKRITFSFRYKPTQNAIHANEDGTLQQSS